MADPHVVRTMRGGSINMMELRKKSKQPMTPAGDQKDKITPHKMPPRQVNIQGFMPTMAGVPNPKQHPTAAKLADKPAEVHVEEDPPTMADMTGIVVDSLKFIKEKPTDTLSAANETLSDIMGDLDQYRKRKAEQELTKPSKRSSKQS